MRVQDSRKFADRLLESGAIMRSNSCRRLGKLAHRVASRKYLFGGFFAARGEHPIYSAIRRSAGRSKWHSVRRMRVSTMRDRGIVSWGFIVGEFPRRPLCSKMYVAEMPQVYVNLDASELPFQVAEKNYLALLIYNTAKLFSFLN